MTKTKTAYAVFSYTNSGKEFMVRGNFGDNQKEAEEWMHNHVNDKWDNGVQKYPYGLIVKPVKYK